MLQRKMQTLGPSTGKSHQRPMGQIPKWESPTRAWEKVVVAEVEHRKRKFGRKLRLQTGIQRKRTPIRVTQLV